jgi:hypothetical protein
VLPTQYGAFRAAYATPRTVRACTHVYMRRAFFVASWCDARNGSRTCVWCHRDGGGRERGKFHRCSESCRCVCVFLENSFFYCIVYTTIEMRPKGTHGHIKTRELHLLALSLMHTGAVNEDCECRIDRGMLGLFAVRVCPCLHAWLYSRSRLAHTHKWHAYIREHVCKSWHVCCCPKHMSYVRDVDMYTMIA